jgi:hypothetical protein
VSSDKPDDDRDLSDREKELRKWDKPHVFQEFPKMLYRGVTNAAGKLDLENRTAATEAEEQTASIEGWLP